MIMTDHEQRFSSCTLDIIVPEVGLKFPNSAYSAPEESWWSALKDTTQTRDQAFFGEVHNLLVRTLRIDYFLDEQLEFWLTLRVDEFNSEDVPANLASPPIHILTFLAHVQIALEAMYIATAPASGQSGMYLQMPPRTAASMGRLKPPPQKRGGGSAGISIFPPTTPHPMPAANESDRRYARSEGTMLLASVWGENPAKEAQETETFALAWNPIEKVWVAFYKLAISVGKETPINFFLRSLSWSVAFLRMHVADPLLCLTISATLRDKPVATTQARKPLDDLINAAGGFPVVPINARDPSDSSASNITVKYDINGLEEVNLLEGLAAGI
jgi:hypothetical protein